MSSPEVETHNPSEPRLERPLPPSPPSLHHMGSRYANQPRPRNIPTHPLALCSDCVLCKKKNKTGRSIRPTAEP